MPKVRIFQPRKTAMQSGRRWTKNWVVEFEPGAEQKNDPLMGWAGQGDTLNQLSMTFSSEEEAVFFCKKNGLTFTRTIAKSRSVKRKAYADNFAFKRDKNWTH